MKIAILTKSADWGSTEQLWKAARNRGHDVMIVPILESSLTLGSGAPGIFGREGSLGDVDAVIPRITTFHAEYAFSVLRQFEFGGCATLNTSAAIHASRNKFHTLALLANAEIPIPRTLMTKDREDLANALAEVGGAPVIVKPVLGTQGTGVVRGDTLEGSTSLMEAMLHLGEDVIVQEYIAEAAGRDIRVIICGGKVAAAVSRQAPPGRFRSNVSKGGLATQLEISDEMESLACRAMEAVGLDAGGVDIIESDRGPLVLEVNAAPGLRSVEEATGLDVAGQFVECLDAKAGARRIGRAHEVPTVEPSSSIPQRNR